MASRVARRGGEGGGEIGRRGWVTRMVTGKAGGDQGGEERLPYRKTAAGSLAYAMIPTVVSGVCMG